MKRFCCACRTTIATGEYTLNIHCFTLNKTEADLFRSDHSKPMLFFIASVKKTSNAMDSFSSMYMPMLVGPLEGAVAVPFASALEALLDSPSKGISSKEGGPLGSTLALALALYGKPLASLRDNYES